MSSNWYSLAPGDAVKAIDCESSHGPSSSFSFSFLLPRLPLSGKMLRADFGRKQDCKDRNICANTPTLPRYDAVA